MDGLCKYLCEQHLDKNRLINSISISGRFVWSVFVVYVRDVYVVVRCGHVLGWAQHKMGTTFVPGRIRRALLLWSGFGPPRCDIAMSAIPLKLVYCWAQACTGDPEDELASVMSVISVRFGARRHVARSRMSKHVIILSSEVSVRPAMRRLQKQTI